MFPFFVLAVCPHFMSSLYVPITCPLVCADKHTKRLGIALTHGLELLRRLQRVLSSNKPPEECLLLTQSRNSGEGVQEEKSGVAYLALDPNLSSYTKFINDEPLLSSPASFPCSLTEAYPSGRHL